MTEYIIEELNARDIETHILPEQIRDYLTNQGLVCFGGRFGDHRYYHSETASVALEIHDPTRHLAIHVVASEAKFIDDLVEKFPLLKK